MKKILTIILILTAFALSSAPAAYAVDAKSEQLSALVGGELYDALPESAELAHMEIEDALDTEAAFHMLVSRAKEKVREAASSIVKDALKLVGVAAVCALTSAVFPIQGDIDYIELAGVLSVAALASSGVTGFITRSGKVIGELSVFSRALLPTLAAASTASGAAAGGAAKLAAAALFSDVFITVSENVVLPLISGLFALSVALCAFPNSGLDGAAAAMKKLIKAVLTVMTLTFTVYISVAGIVADTADAATVRVAKSVISSSMPVVGGMISDAASTVLSGVSVLKSSIGVFGIIAVACVCLSPFILLAVNYVTYKAAALFSGCVAGKAVAKMTGAVAEIYALLLGVVGADAIMLFISILSLVRTVSA